MGSGAFSDLQFQAGSGEQEVSSTGKIRDKWRGFILVIAEKKNPTCRGLSLAVCCLYQLIYKIPKTEFLCEKSEKGYSLKEVLTQLFGNLLGFMQYK